MHYCNGLSRWHNSFNPEGPFNFWRVVLLPQVGVGACTLLAAGHLLATPSGEPSCSCEDESCCSLCTSPLSMRFDALAGSLQTHPKQTKQSASIHSVPAAYPALNCLQVHGRPVCHPLPQPWKSLECQQLQ